MTMFVRRLAVDVAVALVAMTAVTVATAGVSSADCDPNWSHILSTNECKPPPPPPPWWTPPPQYAPMYAPPWAPPPPPRPPWVPPSAIPSWDQGHQQWTWVLT
jgi:hypothetical protein